MHGLNIVGVIVALGAVHAAGTDMVGNDVTVVGELLFANTANAVLGNDLPVEQLAYLPVRAQLAVSAWMLGIVDAPNAQLTPAAFFRDCLPAAAGQGAVYGAELVSAESHEILLVSQKASDELELGIRFREKECAI